MSLQDLLISTIGVFGGLFSYGIIKDLQRKAIKRMRFEGRQSLTESLETIYERFYASSHLDKDKVLRYWQETARLLGLEAGKLRPNDSFDQELAPVKGQELSDEVEDVVEFFDWVSQEDGIEFDPRNIKTLGDLVKTFAVKC